MVVGAAQRYEETNRINNSIPHARTLVHVSAYMWSFTQKCCFINGNIFLGLLAEKETKKSCGFSFPIFTRFLSALFCFALLLENQLIYTLLITQSVGVVNNWSTILPLSQEAPTAFACVHISRHGSHYYFVHVRLGNIIFVNGFPAHV